MATVEVLDTDITTLGVAAIANAANTDRRDIHAATMRPGGPTDADITRRATAAFEAALAT
jgi:O-acetyl-ADP-ribose deacetylase (regulator of RNase III)